MTAPRTTRTTTRLTTRRLTGAAAALALGLTACGSDDDTGDDSGADGEAASGDIVFWTPHATPQRLAIQEQLATEFTEETGIGVEVVGLDAASANQAIVAGAASGDVPDVVLHRPDQTAAWTAQGLLDGEAAQEVVDTLGVESFSPYSLDLVTLDGELQAVPSDGWGQFLYYRSDVFDQLGIDPPETLNDIAAAAEAINQSDADMAGIVIGTAPGEDFTTQTLESLMLANDCQLFTDDEATLDTDNCVNALAAYQDIVAQSVTGEQTVDSVRAAYLAGDAAMAFFSSHFLDELAGVDGNFPVTCPECTDDPQFLAKNSGVVGLLAGPDNDEPTTYGITLDFGILRGANTEAAQLWVEFLLSDGYMQSLSTATEGRVPVRTGTTDDPESFVAQWRGLPLGADPSMQVPFDEAYSDDVISAVVDGANGFSRWGLGTEHAAVAGSLAAENALAEDLQTLFSGSDPTSVADAMQATAETALADAAS